LRTVSATKLYLLFQRIVNERKRAGRTEDVSRIDTPSSYLLIRSLQDPLQYLIDKGDSMKEIIEVRPSHTSPSSQTDSLSQFIIGALFAGLLNSGVNAACSSRSICLSIHSLILPTDVLCYLSLSPKYLALARAEIESVAAAHSDPSKTLSQQLADIPLDAWETDFPVLDRCLKDSIRLHLQGSALRRNVSGKTEMVEDEEVGDGVILVRASPAPRRSALTLGDRHIISQISTWTQRCIPTPSCGIRIGTSLSAQRTRRCRWDSSAGEQVVIRVLVCE
jgi:hypothetical protein